MIKKKKKNYIFRKAKVLSKHYDYYQPFTNIYSKSFFFFFIYLRNLTIRCEIPYFKKYCYFLLRGTLIVYSKILYPIYVPFYNNLCLIHNNLKDLRLFQVVVIKNLKLNKEVNLLLIPSSFFFLLLLFKIYN